MPAIIPWLSSGGACAVLYNTQFNISIYKWLPVLIRYGLNKAHKVCGKNPQSTVD